MTCADLDEFVGCYRPNREATWSEDTPAGRWRPYAYEEIIVRDKVSLDLFRLRDDSLEDSANLPDPHYSEPDTGTIQGSVLSPLLGNVYLHYVLDLWFEAMVKPRLRGRATLIRYCDDFVIGFEHEQAQERERSGDLRLPGVHALLGAIAEGSMGNVVQDSKRESKTGDTVDLRLESSPSSPVGQGATRSAQQTTAGSLQLLRRERQLSQFAHRASPSTARTVLEDVHPQSWPSYMVPRFSADL